jgi:hypothetical protein
MTTLEQVEKLREKANVSYDEAKAALDATNGDLLEALILLEKQGKVTAPAGGGYYNSEKQPPYANVNPGPNNQYWEQPRYRNYNNGESFASMMKRFGRFCLKILQKGNSNSFEVLKGTESKASMPITALVLLIIFLFWVTIPLLVIGLFFGFRYRFAGPDFGADVVNHAMDSAADAAESLKSSITNYDCNK